MYVYVDLVCLTIRDRELHVLTVERQNAPAGMLALPGGLLEEDEGLAEAAVRELREETGITVNAQDIHQIGAYGDPDRDTRYGRAISIAHLALVPTPDAPLPGSDARRSSFVPVAETLRKSKSVMEFDHQQIINDACELAKRLLEDTLVATQFCGKHFTMSHLRHVYEAFLGYEVDPANFRKKVESVKGFVVPVGTLKSAPTSLTSSAGRPAQVYKRGSAKELNPPVRFRTK